MGGIVDGGCGHDCTWEREVVMGKHSKERLLARHGYRWNADICLYVKLDKDGDVISKIASGSLADISYEQLWSWLRSKEGRWV